MDVNEVRQGIRNAENISAKRLCAKKKANYANKIALLTKWIHTHSSNEVSCYYDNEKEKIKLPIPTPILIDFFLATLVLKTELWNLLMTNQEEVASYNSSHYRVFSNCQQCYYGSL